MAVIKINPNKLMESFLGTKKHISDFEKTYQKLCDVINNNEAKLDMETQSALKTSCISIKEKFDAMNQYLNEVLEIPIKMGNEFYAINEKYGKSVSKYGI